MAFLGIAILMGMVALLSLFKIVDRQANKLPAAPWDYAFSVFAMFSLASLFVWNSQGAPLPTFKKPAPPNFSSVMASVGSLSPAATPAPQFRRVDGPAPGLASVADPELRKLFETRGGLGADEDCKTHDEAVRALNASQRDWLVKVLAQRFDPERFGPPPVSPSLGCALGVAASLETIDEPLVGALLAQLNQASLLTYDVAKLLLRAKYLPSEQLVKALESASPNTLRPLLDVVRQVPTNDFEPFASQVQNKRELLQAAYLLVLSHSPIADSRVAEVVRLVLRTRTSLEVKYSALIAASNALPATEALAALTVIARSPTDGDTLAQAVRVANNPQQLAPLVPLILESWDPFNLLDNIPRVETLSQLSYGMTTELPLVAKALLLVPPSVMNWEQRLRSEGERCYRALQSSMSPGADSCIPDVAPTPANSCDGPNYGYSPRLEQVINRIEVDHPKLIGNLKSLLEQPEPRLREFAVHVLGRVDPRDARSLLSTAERDRSLRVAGTALATELTINPGDVSLDKRITEFLKRATSANCFTTRSFHRVVSQLGVQGVEALLHEMQFGGNFEAAADALSDVDHLPSSTEDRLLKLASSERATNCSERGPLVAYLAVLAKIDSQTGMPLNFIDQVLLGSALPNCSEDIRLAAGLNALAKASASNPKAFDLLKRRGALVNRIRAGQAIVNSALLRSSKTDGRRMLREFQLASAEAR